MDDEDVIVKDMPKTQIIKRGDQLIYYCKKCKTEFENETDWRRHLHSCRSTVGSSDVESETAEPAEPAESEPTESAEMDVEVGAYVEDEIVDKSESVDKSELEPRRPRRSEPRRPKKVEVPKTPEEEMIESMAGELRRLLQISPGIDRSKIDWAIQYFKATKAVQNNERRLYEFLSKTFPRADDEVISFIVDSVMAVAQEYKKERRGYIPIFHRNRSIGTSPVMFDEDVPPTTATTDPYTMAMWMMWKMMQEWRSAMYQQYQQYQQPQQTLSREELEKYIEAEVERRTLREQVQQMREDLKTLISKVSERRPISESGWSDDYARLVAELGDRLLSLGEKIVSENKKTRQLFVKKVLPKILGVREEEEAEMIGEGRTDEDVIRELEKMGEEVG